MTWEQGGRERVTRERGGREQAGAGWLRRDNKCREGGARRELCENQFARSRLAADPEPGGAEHPYGPCRDQTRRQRLGLGEEIGGGGSFFAEMKFEPQSGREVEVGGTALSTWLLLLFSTQLKGECSLIWTRGEEKRSGTGICQEGAGKQRERRRGESGQRIAQGGVCSPAGEDGAGLEQGAIVLGERGASPRPPQTRRAGADAGKVFWDRFFPADCRLGNGKRSWVWGAPKEPAETPGEAKGRRAGAWRARMGG